MAMTRARWCQTTTGAGWPGEYRFLLCPLPSRSDFLTPLLPGHPHHIALVSRALKPSILLLPDSKEPSVGRCRMFGSDEVLRARNFGVAPNLTACLRADELWRRCGPEI